MGSTHIQQAIGRRISRYDVVYRRRQTLPVTFKVPVAFVRRAKCASPRLVDTPDDRPRADKVGRREPQCPVNRPETSNVAPDANSYERLF